MIQDDVSPRSEETVLDLLEAASTLERQLDRALSSTRGISFSEYRLLRTLSRANAGGFPRIDLARAVGLSASAVTRALKPLEKLGYVTTTRNERDARQSLASLTSAGRELLGDARSVVQDTLTECPLNSLSPKQLVEFRSRLIELRGAR